jgi:hypothetical protein
MNGGKTSNFKISFALASARTSEVGVSGWPASREAS